MFSVSDFLIYTYIFFGVDPHLLAFCKVFACYDLRILTLICVVWLVGSDHHSICEVLLAARAHGLAYDFENAEEYTAAMLASLA